ncbi:hypothetical protein HDC91_003129 [Mucilaginibacter sp. AK015]|nr:hypothetical protein [Mucilaginibacter sp. AK015]
MAGGITFEMYVNKMQYKYSKTLKIITAPVVMEIA